MEEKIRRRRLIDVKQNDIEIDTAIMDFFAAPHLRLNKDIINIYGLDPALWIADVFSRWNYFRKEKKLIKGFFFVTQKEIRETTKLNFNKQSAIIKFLTDKQIIEVKKQGIPAKNRYKLKISALILDIKTIKNKQDLRSKSFGLQGTAPLDCKELNNKNNCNKNNEIVSKDTYVSSKHLDIIISIINFWNNLPNTTTHSNTETKLYKNISLQIENLLCGKPLIRKKDDSPTEPFLDFVEDDNISRKVYLKEWKEEDIKKIFQIINDGIENDDSKKVSMDQIFWNAFAKKRGGGFSLFLHIAANTDFDLKRKSVVSKFIHTMGKRTDYKTKIQWGKQFDDFINQDEVSEDEIIDALDWYGIHRGEKYIPVIDNPSELQEKYSKLKAAINRSKEPSSNSQPTQPTQQIQKSNPTKESLNLFSNEEIETWVEEYESLTNLLANADIWPPNYFPDKDKIYSALLEIKNWKNNMIHTDYSQIRRVTGSVRIICNNYIDWIDRQGWLDDGIKEGSLFPSSKMFKQHFIPDLEGDILDIALRSKGWGKDEDLKMESVLEIEARGKQEAEHKREQKETERINAENRKENTLWMHSCMKKHLLDLEGIGVIDISKWQDDLNKSEFEKIVIAIEKKHQEEPTNRGNSYRFLFSRTN